MGRAIEAACTGRLSQRGSVESSAIVLLHSALARFTYSDHIAVNLTQEQRTLIATELRQFLEDELDVHVGTFESADLADFVVDKIGPWIYNQGVLDTRAKLSGMLEGIQDELSLLEKSSPLDR